MCVVMLFILFVIVYSPTKVKHHLTCFNNIFSNNELISNRFAVIIYFCCRYKGKHIEVKMFLSDFVHRSAKNNFNVCGK
jgi:hypothetical protein